MMKLIFTWFDSYRSNHYEPIKNAPVLEDIDHAMQSLLVALWSQRNKHKHSGTVTVNPLVTSEARMHDNTKPLSNVSNEKKRINEVAPSADENIASTSSPQVVGESAKADAASSLIEMRRSAKDKDQEEVEFDSNTLDSKYLSLIYSVLRF
jgi:hypothetical protein